MATYLMKLGNIKQYNQYNIISTGDTIEKQCSSFMEKQRSSFIVFFIYIISYLYYKNIKQKKLFQAKTIFLFILFKNWSFIKKFM